jgi:hypothetical protein
MRGWQKFVMRLVICVIGIGAADAWAGPYVALGKFEPEQAGTHRKAVDPALMLQYQQAVADAAQADWSEVVDNLLAVAPQTPGLQWDTSGTTRVLAVTWTGWTGYDALAGTTTTLSRDVWITLVPEAKHFATVCGLQGAALTLRLEQLIGLPPGNGATRFVEMWVDPEDLFRPSADPEINDRTALPTWPRSSRYVSVSAAHRAWIENLMATSYGANGYPWTRLGYTYDWGNPNSEHGASEYIVPAGAVVKIQGATLTADYHENVSNGAQAWSAYP